MGGETMDVETALPRLLADYRRGALVPFIGSGMSVPACTSWTAFLAGLARSASYTVPAELQQRLDTRRASSTELYRLADRCVRRLKARGHEALATPGARRSGTQPIRRFPGRPRRSPSCTGRSSCPPPAQA